MARSRQRAQNPTFLYLVVGLLLLLPSPASAIELGIPTTPEPEPTGCSGLSGIIAELDSNYAVTLKNCSGDPARSLIELAFSTPGQTPGHNTYSADETMVTLNHAQQTTCQVTGVSGGGDNVIGVLITSARVPATGDPASRLIGTPLVLQRFENANTPRTPLTDAIRQQLDRDLLQRNSIAPISEADEPCQIVAFDDSTSYVENRGPGAWRGVYRGKFICSLPDSEPSPCSNDRALASTVTYLGLNPEACVKLTPKGSGTAGFNYCCDPATSVSTEDRASWTMQCTRAVITEIVTAQGAMTLDPFYWAPFASDVRPARYNESPATPANIGYGCFDFASPEQITDNPGQCIESGLYCDIDSDGVFDRCDFFVGTEVTPQGGSINIKNRLRNQFFNDLGLGFEEFTESAVATVRVGGQTFPTTISTSNNDLDFVVGPAEASTFPSFTPLQIDVCADSNCTDFSASTTDTLEVRHIGMIALGGADRLFSFDPGTGDIVDIDSSFDNSIINLPGGAVATGVAFSMQNAELYVTGGDKFHVLARSGAGYPAITSSVTVGPDVQELVMDDDGRFAFVLHGSNQVGAVHVDDAAGVSPRFSVATSLGTTLGYARRLAVRNLTPDGDDLRFEVFTTSSCSDCGPGTSDCSSGSISRLEPDPASQPAVLASRGSAVSGIASGQETGLWPSGSGLLATSLLAPFLQSCEPGDCEFLPDPPPGGGGGGGTDNRQVWLNTHVLRANRDAAGNVVSWDVECVEKQMISSEPVSPGMPNWEHVGLALNSDSSMLYVVSPESHELVAIDTASLSEVDRVTVGTFPFDVTVVPVMTGQGIRERAYVANHGDGEVDDDDSMSIVSLENFSGTPLQRDLNNDFGLSEDIHLERIAGLQARFLGGGVRARYIYLVSGATGRVLAYFVGNDGMAPTLGPVFSPGPNPGPIAFQRP